MYRKRLFLILLLIYTSSVLLLGCNIKSNSKDILSYSTAEEFEDALNNGDDVLGAMVTFNAGITEPGPGSYNMHSGKKLAFTSNNHPNISPGSTVTVKVISVKNVGGTWYIKYEK